jgi:hypothetical protein
MRAHAELFYDQNKNSYGKANSNGSCTSPTKGSLFDNSEPMALVLNATDNIASCYSTSKGYAISVPLASDPTTMWCLDNVGGMKETKVPLTSTICK